MRDLRFGTPRTAARAVPNRADHNRLRSALLIAVLATVALLLIASELRAQPNAGMRQEFSTAGVGGWAGGTPSSNPGSGGRIGGADGYLLLNSAFPGNYGQHMQQPDPAQGDLGIDSILLTNGTVGIGHSPAASAIRLASPYPNPSRGAVTFALDLPDAEPIRLQIIDVTGRSIRHAELAGGASGPRTWMWDGRDDAGRLAAPGAYRVRAASSAGAISRPFTRIR